MDFSPTTPEELKGWYAFGFAVEGYAALAVAVFYPIILESLSASNAVESIDYSIPCNTSTSGYDCKVHVGGIYIPTTSLVFYATAISVICQFILFVSLGALADHGSHRKEFILWFGFFSCGVGLLILAIVRIQEWWLAYVIFIVTNIAYGASFVFYYAYVPLLARNDPLVIAAREKANRLEYYRTSEIVSNNISSKGFFYSYVGAVIVLFVGAGIALLVDDGKRLGLTSTYGLQIGVAFSCIWGLVFLTLYTRPLLKERPGPPLPKNANYLFFSWSKVYNTLSKGKQLPETFKFLLGWFIYSDGFSTISSVAILFAQAELGASKLYLILAAIIAPLFAGIGSIVWIWIQNKFGLATRQILLIHVFMYSLLPVYGLVFFKTKIELLPAAAYHGFLLGATQSSCRVMFSELLPPGMEAEFFGLYEITDKGSAWVGPLVVGAIRASTGSMRSAFYFLLAILLLPGLLFYSVDLAKGKRDGIKFAETIENIELDDATEVSIDA